MKAFSSSIAIATVRKKDKIRVQNVKNVGKGKVQDEFIKQITGTKKHPFFFSMIQVQLELV
jgi:hypothetical protein